MDIAERARRAAETVLGLLLALTPVALWVAWTPEMALAVLALAAASACVLVRVTRDGGAQVIAGKAELDDDAVAELHGLFPLVYHHSRHETPAFRRVMERLRRSSSAR